MGSGHVQAGRLTPTLCPDSRVQYMKAKEVGIDGFLVKPVGIADLTVRVDRAMRVYAR